jgi:alkylhydroperoxidase family enzyme
MANHEGLDVIKAREVPRWRESDVSTPLERDVLEYAEAMTQTPSAVTDEAAPYPVRKARAARRPTFFAGESDVADSSLQALLGRLPR